MSDGAKSFAVVKVSVLRNDIIKLQSVIDWNLVSGITETSRALFGEDR
jgi:uncharacterized protein with FMN-binding domain